MQSSGAYARIHLVRSTFRIALAASDVFGRIRSAMELGPIVTGVMIEGEVLSLEMERFQVIPDD